MTQQKLAAALKVVPSLISSWEKGTPPPQGRLDDYALFFATRRSLAGPRLLSVDELADDEEAARQELAAELRELRRVAVGESERAQMGRHWRFTDGAPVQLLCGKITKSPLRKNDFADETEEKETGRSKYASGREWNYMALMAYADLDSLVELFGHIRASNPRTTVGFDLDARLESDDLTGHLVVVGGMGEYTGPGETILKQAGIPIGQVPDPEMPDWGDEGEIFEVEGDPPVFHRPIFAGSRLIEDVGLFVRAPNPYNPETTVTFVSGVFTRGGYGAVRMLTDAALRERNEDFLAKRFAGENSYAVLVRVRVHGHATVTPDLTAPGVLRYVWPNK